MQTPLQELIEWIKQEDIEAPFNERWNPADNIIAKATELIEKEREAIIGAFDDGYYSGSNKYTSVISDNGKNYYTKTFTNESK